MTNPNPCLTRLKTHRPAPYLARDRRARRPRGWKAFSGRRRGFALLVWFLLFSPFILRSVLVMDIELRSN